MKVTKKPGKSRKYAYTAPKHKKAKALAAHLSEKLSKEVKKRSLPVRKKDIVKIVRGEFKGKDGKVIKVDHKNHKIFVDKIVRKKSNGTEYEVAIDPSNVIIMDLDNTDKKRI